MKYIDDLTMHIHCVPHYHWKNSQYRYLKYKFANWLLDDKLKEVSKWYATLKKLNKDRFNDKNET